MQNYEYIMEKEPNMRYTNMFHTLILNFRLKWDSLSVIISHITIKTSYFYSNNLIAKNIYASFLFI